MKLVKLLILFITIMLVGCSPWKERYSKKYVKGEIIKKPYDGRYGIFLLENKHENSFYAFIREDRLKAINSDIIEDKEAFAILEEVEGVLFATSISPIEFEGRTLKEDVTSPLDLHMFEKHGLSDKIHRRGHIRDRTLFEITSSNDFKYPMFLDSGNTEEFIIVTEANHDLIQLLHQDLPADQVQGFYYEIENGFAININICHQHGITKEDCLKPVKKQSLGH